MQGYRGEANTVVVPGEKNVDGVIANTIVVIGAFLGVAKDNAPAGHSFSLAITGAWELNRQTGLGTAWAFGDPVYWDKLAGLTKAIPIIENVQETDLHIGTAVEPTTDTDPRGQLRLNGIF